MEIIKAQGADVAIADVIREMSISDIASSHQIIRYLTSTSEGYCELFHKAVKCSEYIFTENLLNGIESASVFNIVSLSRVLKCPFQKYSEARKYYISFVKELLSIKDIHPDGEALDNVLDHPKEYQAEKIELLTLLLEHGAAIDQCTYQRRSGTTLLHIATRFAIESGMHRQQFTCRVLEYSMLQKECEL
jgi:hypothetical protein